MITHYYRSQISNVWQPHKAAITFYMSRSCFITFYTLIYGPPIILFSLALSCWPFHLIHCNLVIWGISDKHSQGLYIKKNVDYHHTVHGVTRIMFQNVEYVNMSRLVS